MTSSSNAEEGFTLLEMVCILAVIAMVAAVVLPNISRNTSRPRLEAYAVETASLLKADRTAAIRHRGQVVTQVDAIARTLRSGSTGQILRFPTTSYSTPYCLVAAMIAPPSPPSAFFQPEFRAVVRSCCLA